MSKSRHIKNYRTQFPTASEEVIDALKKSDRKIKYTEHELKCGKYDKAKIHTIKAERFPCR